MKYSKVLLGLVMMIVAYTAESAPKKIKIVADPWCPYTCDAKSDKPGYLIDIVKAAFKGSAYEPEYEVVAWARALKDTRDGKFHAIAGTYEIDKEGLLMGPSLGKSQSCFYGKKATAWKYEGIPSLSKVSVGSVIGYTYDTAVDEYLEKNKDNPKLVQMISGDSPLPQNLKKLEAGRIQILIENKSVIAWELTSTNSKQDVESKGCVDSTDVFVSFSAKHPEGKALVKAFEEGVKRIRASGEYDQILKKYGLL